MVTVIQNAGDHVRFQCREGIKLTSVKSTENSVMQSNHINNMHNVKVKINVHNPKSS